MACQQHNWLVHRIHDAMLAEVLERHAHGVMVDLGCGTKPYAPLVGALVSRHFGVDYLATLHDKSQVDLFTDICQMGFANSSVDTILCTAVLEHLEFPEIALCEMSRILRPGGYAIFTAPLFWHIHEEPRDFYRFTRFGLASLLQRAGFEIVEIQPLSGFIVTFGQELCYYLQTFRNTLFGSLIGPVQWLVQWIAFHLNSRDHSSGFTWAYLAVVRRPPTEADGPVQPSTNGEL